jgi:hypothetical protein
MMQLFLTLTITAVTAVVLAMLWTHDVEKRARRIRQLGAAVMAATAALFLLFLIGDALGDPGGVAGVALIAAVLVPLAALCVLAATRGDLAVRVLTIAALLLVAATAWAAVDAGSWRSFEDGLGPVRTVATFVVAAPLGLLGWRRPARAGGLLVGIALMPLAISRMASAEGLASGSLAAVSAPALVTGLLYLASYALERHQSASRPRTMHRTRHA